MAKGLRALLICTGVALLTAGAVSAQQPAPTCSSGQAHEFDFWIGEWDVTVGGNPAGTNSIQPILDGCVLQETWSGASGSAGSSFNFYDPQKKAWRQFWVWRNGTTLELQGSYADGKMTLEGGGVDSQGRPIRNRITWYDNPDGTVRQHWQTSSDGGETWQDSFDGLYRKKS